MVIEVSPARASDAAELADVAAHTFPLACPVSAPPESIAVYVATQLSADRFAEYVRKNRVLVARHTNSGPIVGYAMLVEGVEDDPQVRRAVSLHPAIRLSKLYVLPEFHREGVAAALMTDALATAEALGAAGIWLGVNQENQRAQRFYTKHGFNRTGTMTFQLGDRVEHDYVMQRPVAGRR